jgi:WD40 repeat protein
MSGHIGSRVGQQFGNYSLVRFLGQGGFAEVYLGQHVFLNTWAAIKVLRTQLTQDEQEDFLREARTIAHLAHPNIIRVLDFGMQDDIPFLVMDYAPNGSLRERHPRRTPVPPDVIISYVRQIAAALQYAHDAKLIHRDVKPENMLLGRSGEVLLGDFGISVVAQSSRSQSTQAVTGSAPYMAPEQLQGRPRPSSDQYALGIVVYEWLCGDRPFQGSFTELYGQHLFAPPPPLRERNSTIPASVELVVMTALAKDPHQRFVNILAFANAFEQAWRLEPASSALPSISPSLTSHAATTVVSPSSSLYTQTTMTPSSDNIYTPGALSPAKGIARQRLSRRVVLMGLAGLVVIGAGGAWYTLSQRHPPQGTLIYKYLLHNDSIHALSWRGERIVSGSQDNTAQVWDATTGNNVHIYRNQGNAVNGVAWSPDGTRVALASDDGTVLIWNPSATAPDLIYKGHMNNNSGRALSVAWSPDGKYIASGGNDDTVRVWDAKNGTTVLIYKGHTDIVGAVAWSPDGTRIASGSNDDTVQVWDALTGKNVYKYTNHQSSVYSVAWSPDGTHIASAGADKTAQVWDPNAQGQALTYTGHTDYVNSVAWSADGHYLATASSDKMVHVWSPTNTGKPYIYRRHTAGVDVVVWGDSHRVASAGEDKTVQVWEGV